MKMLTERGSGLFLFALGFRFFLAMLPPKLGSRNKEENLVFPVIYKNAPPIYSVLIVLRWKRRSAKVKDKGEGLINYIPFGRSFV